MLWVNQAQPGITRRECKKKARFETSGLFYSCFLSQDSEQAQQPIEPDMIERDARRLAYHGLCAERH
jgi:hypothetical protein